VNRYQELFDQYVDELSKAKKAAESWWRRLVAAQAATGVPKAQAEERIRERWPMGPTSHPRVLAIYRKYFIACEQLNAIVADEFQRKLLDEDAHDVDGWGVEEARKEDDGSDGDWGAESVMDPPMFLIDSLAGRRDDLGDFMMFLVFAPIGEENDRSI
jgi:hypothetical protein